MIHKCFKWGKQLLCIVSPQRANIPDYTQKHFVKLFHFKCVVVRFNAFAQCTSKIVRTAAKCIISYSILRMQSNASELVIFCFEISSFLHDGRWKLNYQNILCSFFVRVFAYTIWSKVFCSSQRWLSKYQIGMKLNYFHIVRQNVWFHVRYGLFVYLGATE